MARPLGSPAECRAALDDLEALVGKTHPLVVSALRDHALRRWLELNAESALSFAEADVGLPYQPSIANDLFRVWLDLDVDSALSSFAQASPSLVKTVRNSFFSNFAQIDPERAVAELANPRWKGARGWWHDYSTRNVFAIWASKDPEGAAEMALEWKNERKDTSAFSGVAEVWGQSDPLAAWEFIQTHKFANDAKQMLIGYLLERDPEADIGEHKDHQWRRIARPWADRDYQSAIDFARSRPEGDPLAHQLILRAASKLASSEPEHAMELLNERGPSDWEYDYNGILWQAFASMAASDLDQSLERWRGLPEELRTFSLAGIITQQHATDQNETLKNLRTWIDDPSIGEAVLPAMAIALSHGHGGGAQDLGSFIEEFPEFGTHVGEYLLQGWVRTDPEAAAGFIAKKVEANGGKDIGENSSIAELAFSRPEFTAGWLPTLPEGEFQITTAASLAANWSRFSPDAAAAWVEGLADGAMKDAAAKGLGK